MGHVWSPIEHKNNELTTRLPHGQEYVLGDAAVIMAVIGA